MRFVVPNQPELGNRVVLVIADKQIIGPGANNMILWLFCSQVPITWDSSLHNAILSQVSEACIQSTKSPEVATGIQSWQDLANSVTNQ